MRNAQWHTIWDRKGAVDRQRSLHVINGYDLLSDEDWLALVGRASAPLGLRATDRVLEFGCGAGAFLASLQTITPGLTVAGIDYSAPLITVARARVVGAFEVHDITRSVPFAAASYDVAVAFGVVNYLNSEADVAAVVRDMCRVAGRTVYIGEVNDARRRDTGESIRRATHKDSKRVSPLNVDQLWIAPTLFQTIAAEQGMTCHIVDHQAFGLDGYAATAYRYSAYLNHSSSSRGDTASRPPRPS